jgi:hypothetical protein
MKCDYIWDCKHSATKSYMWTVLIYIHKDTIPAKEFVTLSNKHTMSRVREKHLVSAYTYTTRVRYVI